MAFSFFKARISKVNQENRAAVSSALVDAESKWEILVSILPMVFYRNTDKTLKTQYKLEEVEKALANPTSYPNSLLADFVNLIGVSNADFITAVQSGSTGMKITIFTRTFLLMQSSI